MSHYSFNIIYLVIFMIELLKPVLTLTPEGIINGRNARQVYFRYQVDVVSKRNFSDIFCSMCGGGILNRYFVISAAHCTLDIIEEELEESVYIRAGVTYLHSPSVIEILVDIIFYADFDNVFSVNDISLLKLKDNLLIGQDIRLSTLNLPNEDQPIKGKVALIAGFGNNWIRLEVDSGTGELVEIGDSDDLLKWARVRIASDEECLESYPMVNNQKQFCGVMIPFDEDETAGICTGDSGSPLVYRNQILGIAVRNEDDCDDTVKGAIYTRVSAYLTFIRNILDGISSIHINVYQNRPHIPAPVL